MQEINFGAQRNCRDAIRSTRRSYSKRSSKRWWKCQARFRWRYVKDKFLGTCLFDEGVLRAARGLFQSRLYELHGVDENTYKCQASIGFWNRYYFFSKVKNKGRLGQNNINLTEKRLEELAETYTNNYESDKNLPRSCYGVSKILINGLARVYAWVTSWIHKPLFILNKVIDELFI